MVLCLGVTCLAASESGGGFTLSGHVSALVKSLQPVGRLPATNHMVIAIGLPLRNKEALTNMLEQVYDPSSANYRHFLTPAEFTERFGPTEADYESVIRFATTNGLHVTQRFDNRVRLKVEGNVSDVERAFRLTLRTYRHPTEDREFFAPDVEPSVDARVPILSIDGLNSLAMLRSTLHLKPSNTTLTPATGSGSGGSYFGGDFRRAYAPGLSLNGAGQMLGIVAFDGYYTNDIVSYENKAGQTRVPLVNVLLDGATGVPSTNYATEVECEVDMEMASAMAPGLAALVVFQSTNAPISLGAGPVDYGDVLSAMVSSNQIKQFSSSWGYEGNPNPNPTFDEIYQQMALQGQAFFEASGDADAWANPIWVPAASPYVTCVGATVLSMSGSGSSYSSETVWNSGAEANEWGPNLTYYWGSGGGVSSNYSIPGYQQGVSMTNNGGSANFRNIPDVTLAGASIYLIFANGDSGAYDGTSMSTPLWAGFMAMVNQQAASYGGSPVGFANPALYAIGKSTNYAACFHDITTGNNVNDISGGNYDAVAGFDLCSGWGSPKGASLINALAPPPEPLRITPGVGFVSTGYVGGPFSVTNQSLTLSNIGFSSLTWSLGDTSSWLNLSPSSGTLAAGAKTSVTASLTSVCAGLRAGSYAGTVWFTNRTDGVSQSCMFSLNVQLPPLKAPAIEGVQRSNGTVAVTWSALDGLSYQLQYSADLTASNWANLGNTIVATNGTCTAFDTSGAAPWRYYRVVVLP